VPRHGGQGEPRGIGTFLRPTSSCRTDGMVKATASKNYQGPRIPMWRRPRAIYEWIVENTFPQSENARLRRRRHSLLLESGDLGGKCADLKRAVRWAGAPTGLPARRLWHPRRQVRNGIQEPRCFVRESDKAQHCRARFTLVLRWVPVDPADVRKVVLEERPEIDVGGRHSQRRRARLFGSWEMNWMAYNFAARRRSARVERRPVAFFMYPAGGNRRRPTRQSRSGQLKYENYVNGETHLRTVDGKQT